MSAAVFVYHSPIISAFHNLALEEHLLRSRPEGNYVLLWQSANTVVIGRHQNLPEEINLPYAEERGIAVVRRSTGGGAVYHDAGNLNFSFIGPAARSVEVAMQHFTRPVVEALNSLGVPAELSGRNDIMAGEKKISGNAQMLLGGRMLHHGTLLYDSELSVLAGVLKVRPEKFISKSAKSVRSRVGNIVEFLKKPLTVNEFAAYLLERFGSAAGARPLELSPADEAAIARLRADKYECWDWNHGRSPVSGLVRLRKFPGGMLEARLDIRAGRIADCAFYGDFMALRPAEEVAAVLCGIPFSPGEVEAALAAFGAKAALEEYFGGITAPEVVACLFDKE